MGLVLLSRTYTICVVFWPAFGCCEQPKAGRNTFFEPFSTFFVHFKPFSVISHLKSRKNIWKWTKNSIFPFLFTLQSWSTCKRWSTQWGGTMNASFLVDFCWKQLKKIILISFRVSAEPQSWSKYTTHLVRKLQHLNMNLINCMSLNLSSSLVIVGTYISISKNSYLQILQLFTRKLESEGWGHFDYFQNFLI